MNKLYKETHWCEKFNMVCPCVYANVPMCMEEQNIGMPCHEEEYREDMEEMRADEAEEFISALKTEMDFYLQQSDLAMKEGWYEELDENYFINQSILHDMGINYDSKEIK